MTASPWKKLTPNERKLLKRALLEAYNTSASLRKMLDDELDWKLAAISSDAHNLDDNLADVLQYAETLTAVEPFMVAARLGNPGNQLLSDAMERIMSVRRPAYFRSGATPLSTAHQEILVNALLQCSSLSNGSNERPPVSILVRLPKDLLTQIVTEGANTLPDDLRAWCRLVIQYAAKHPGGLEYLADLVVDLEDSQGAKVFEQEVRNRTGGPLRKTLIDYAALVTGAHVEPAFVHALFQQIVPPGSFDGNAIDGPTEEIQLRLILRHLFLLNHTSSGISPIHQFLLKLAEAATDAQGKVAILDHLRAKGVEIPTAQKPVAIEKENGIWSVVVVLSEILRDSMDQEQEYNVAVWIRTDDGRDETVELEPDPGPITQSRLVELGPSLSNVIKDLASLQASTKNEIRVEFFLPDSLFGEDVSLWKIKLGATNVALGKGYPVAIRALARLVVRELRDTWGYWNTKWEQYLEDPHLESIPSPTCEIEGEALLFRLQETEPGARIHGVRLESVHCHVTEPADLDPRSKCKDAGIPVIVWLRRGVVDAHNAKDALTDLLQHAGPNELKNLPKWALAERRRAAATPTSPAHQLAVLWDDPTRIPNGLQSQGVCPDAYVEPRASK